MRVRTETPFFDRAEELRAHFESRVGPTREGAPERFVWDYWHIPEQYTYLRTPALNVVPPSLLGAFTTRLAAWGLANLGCGRVTLPWLSYYLDGCRQELHSDVVQGTWSYVYSLTRWEGRVFTGGETLLGSPRLLDYWGAFDPHRSSEARHLVERVPTLFDQLCVFDSRLPHGVAAVEGTRDPLQARVALHGWFHPPELSVEGGIDLRDVEPVVEELGQRATRRRGALGPLLGLSTWRLVLGADGGVDEVALVVHNLVGPRTDGPSPEECLAAEEEEIRATRFPSSGGPSVVRFPLGG